MNKRIKSEFDEFVYRGEKTPFSLGTLAVVCLCLLLLIVATFTQLNIVHYWLVPDADGNLGIGFRSFHYIPQLPLVLFIAAILGSRFGILVIILYLIIGFFVWPVFALGGGLGYIKSYFFGYILGYFFAVVFASRVLRKDKFSYKSIAYASLVGVLSIHVTGIIYTCILGLFHLVSFSLVPQAIAALSGEKLLYDILFSFILMSFAKPVKSVLWLAMKNYTKPKKEPKTTKEAREMKKMGQHQP